MCQPSARILFCTCELGDDFPDEYWILHRFATGKNQFVVGSPLMFTEDNPVQYRETGIAIRKALNAGDAFDQALVFEKGDILYIRLAAFEQPFGFKYNGQNWRRYRTNDFELVEKYDEIKAGTVKPDLQSFLKTKNG